MTQSAATAFFEGKAFADWKKVKEAELNVQVAIVHRLNSVIEACNVIAKTVARTSR